MSTPRPAAPTRTWSERASMALLAEHGVPFAAERSATTPDEAVAAAEALGYPVVCKLNGDAIAHKTERGLVRLRLGDAAGVRAAARELLAAATPDDGPVDLLVAPMVSGTRELIAGLVDDPVMGRAVMLGVGGILAEAVADVAFRLVPVGEADARELVDDLATQRLLGPFRGEPAVDRDALASVVLALSALAESHPEVVSVDVNPLIVHEGRPVAVDALVEVRVDASPGDLAAAREEGLAGPATVVPAGDRCRDDRYGALFDPAGVVVAGVSTHPGKYGFVALHNILASGYRGRVYATNPRGETVLGVETIRSLDELPAGGADLLFVCTPAAANPALLRAAAAKGVRAAFVASAGYAEAGPEGVASQRELVETAAECGILLAGPNGQGLVSTPSSLCAQIVAPYPPAGAIGIASQSGNLVSSFCNWACATGVGVSRAVSAGNAAMVGVADLLEAFADDPATSVGLAYVETLGDGATFARRLRAVSETMPVVLVKGGSTEGGARAAASHTGALAADDVVFDGMCRQAGVVRAATAEAAFEAAATFATQPLPAGPNVVVVTAAGGWGVVAADAITRDRGLVLAPLPDDLRAAIDEKLPPRWSRSNPVDLAGGETRDTIPEVLALVAGHPDVHAVVYLGLGIQSNQARLLREGGYYPGHGLERIVAYHERQDARFAQASADVSAATGKPVLVATELAVADPANPGPATVRATGRLCYPSADRAVAALAQLYRYAMWLRARGLR